jgi:leucine-rich repeat protein SHOC2
MHLAALPCVLFVRSNRLSLYFRTLHLLHVLTQKLENAKKLGVLSLSEHSLTAIPKQVFELTKLRTIDLSKNRLTSLGSLHHLVELKSINLDFNDLHAGSLGSISSLLKLQNLSLANNKLALSPPTTPATANLTCEPLPTLPPTIRVINLSSNLLASVPRALCSPLLTNLERIDLSSNSIAVIPVELTQLPNLLDLNLDKNLIVLLPDEIGRLTKLKVLSLRDNKIQVSSTNFNETIPQPLPKSLFLDTLLIDLNLHGNKMTNTQLNEFEGFQAFLDRRRQVKSKLLTNLDVCGLQ